MEKYYKISESELLSLLSDANQLNALECVGVDNWCGWDERHEYKDEEVTAEDLPQLYEEVI